MIMCVRCHSNPAMVYLMRQGDKEGLKEGYCLSCAKELGLKIPPEYDNIGNFIQNIADSGLSEALTGDDQGRAPMINFEQLSSMIFGGGKNKESGKDDKSSGAKERGKQQAQAAPSRKSIEQFCINLTEKAKAGKLDRVIGREREIERLIRILCRRQKNNPCLIGEPGVGKTAIAEALAQRIVAEQVPYRLRDKEVLLVDMTALVAGTQFRGQFEGRMKALIGEVKALGNIILVIDEVHSIVGAGDAEGSMNAANILKPALSRGEIQLIGATTLAEYRKYIEKDSALERRFQPIIVEESSIDDTIEILKGIKHYYESFHHLTIPDSILEKTVSLAERYITDRFLPDKAIDLLDEACSYLSLSSPDTDRLPELEKRLSTLTEEENKLGEQVGEVEPEKANDLYKRMADIKTEMISVNKETEKLKKQIQSLVLTENELANVIEIWTGVPASSITEHEFEKLSRLEDNLKSHIVGQDKAVNAVVRAIKRGRVGVSAKRKPVSFIFAGPTGVGKTELVKRLSAELFNAPEALIRLDMSEFMEKHAVSRIIGAPPGYVGYDEAGQLTEKIRRKPYSVVLFDEIEKAHPDVMNILLQILDDGHITDAQGRNVNFENTVIIMTTNAGSQIGNGVLGFGESRQEQNESKTMAALSEFLRPEFINRVDEVITFRSLDREDFKKIAVIMLDELCAALRDRGYKVAYDDKAVAAVSENSFSEKYGARNMRRYIQTNIEDRIAEAVIAAKSAVSLISVSASDDLRDMVISCV